MAVIATVSGFTTFHVQSFKGGVSFGSPMFPPPTEKKPKKVYAALVEGAGLQPGTNGLSGQDID